MQKETMRALAREVAKQIVKDSGTDVDSLLISERLADELPGLDEVVFEQIEDEIDLLIQVASVEVYFQEYRIRDGKALSLAEFDKAELISTPVDY